jgi:glycosyltransferase involved in cell wall biosynthesis
MRVIHVVPTISNEASGPSYSVPRLCEALIAEGADVQLAALAQPSTRIELPFVKTFPLGLGPARLGASPKLRRWLDGQAASGRVQIVHNHSLWMMPNVYPGQACRERRCRLVVSPRGTLSAWALRRSALRKKIFWRWMQEPVLRSAACFHATAESEYEDIRRLGFGQPLCVLPNGIDVPPLRKTSAQDGRRQLLFLGRIHPKKGLDVLLRAWQAVASRFPEWELHVVGPEEGGYRARMQGLAAELRLQRVEFPGPLYGEDKLRAYRRASVFVLPTYSENFGMSVAEALAAGTPAVVTRGAPWSGLVENDAGWWIETGLDSLVGCLEQALANSPQRLDAMGRAGHAWMQRDFCWQRIGRQFMATYQWLLDGGVPPVWVRLD